MNKKLKAALLMSPFLAGLVALCIAEPLFLIYPAIVILMLVTASFVYGIMILSE